MNKIKAEFTATVATKHVLSVQGLMVSCLRLPAFAWVTACQLHPTAGPYCSCLNLVCVSFAYLRFCNFTLAGSINNIYFLSLIDLKVLSFIFQGRPWSVGDLLLMLETCKVFT